MFIKQFYNDRSSCKLHHLFFTTFALGLAVFLNSGCQSKTESAEKEEDISYAEMPDSLKRLPENALKGLKVAKGLEVQLFASEPTITNPTNIDIDHKGRVWVCEAYNYRPEITGNETEEKGDRIVILEDTDGDGKSDKSTVFYQGPELNAPLGIWVMGNRAIVSQSPYVWLFTDTNGDDKADKKEIIFQGIEGEQHDHGMHAFVFGPDGKFYFNFGNEAKQMLDAEGNYIKDINGKEIRPEDYKQGMIFRTDQNFKNIEIMAGNFRNNYEVAVDSYGSMWQSDNDDDGNQATRINFVMDYGNYGYTDEMTGAGWQANRTNKEAEIPQQHWHLNDPGVVPNVLITGAGSPTGIVVYEGRLLPKVYWNQMIHTDAGTNVVRAYPVAKVGAGYKATIKPILEGIEDQWFRPSDVCVAPDGSLMVADWYDPGVGGHQVGDLNRGRIYRIAPPDSPYSVAKHDLNSIEGAIEGLQNPNLSTRYLAWQTLNKKGSEAEKSLFDLYKNHEDPVIQARALWLLTSIEGKGEEYVSLALKNENPDLRIVGLRAARQLRLDLVPVISQLLDEPNKHVLRECAIALRHLKSPAAPALWTNLALKHDGEDRWYLEALGIGADQQWDSYFAEWTKRAGENILKDPANVDIIWRARTGAAVPYLAKLASDSNVELKDRLRYFRAFDFNPDGEGKSAALVAMLKGSAKDQVEIDKLVLSHLHPDFIRTSPLAMNALKKALDEVEGTPEFVEMVARYALTEENTRLLQLAVKEGDSNLGRNAARTLLQQNGEALVRKTLNGEDEATTIHMLEALRGIGNKESLNLIEEVVFNDKASIHVRREAARVLGGSWDGEEKVLALLKADKIPEALKASVVTGVSNAWRRNVRTEAASYLDKADATAGRTPLPPMQELMAMEGDPGRGKTVFEASCQSCHQVDGKGVDFGPKLSEIGSKLPREAQFVSILHPDAGISFGYEGYIVKMKDGSTNVGIIASKTETDLDLKTPGGNVLKLKLNEVASQERLENSLMPAGLENAMTAEELVDLVAYLMSLKKVS